ncbi:MAG: FAD-binding protein [Chloroflexi bacterium]|nr:FAD-binding protein [Chloroflexota bacterium]
MLSKAIIRELEGIVGREHVRGGPAQLVAYSYDGTFQQHIPDIAVTPRTTDEVQRIAALAYRENIPIVPRGAGTSLAGGTIPLTGGIVLSLSRMTTIKDIDPPNTCATVEAGVVTADLQRAVERIGLFYPPDPASLNQSTLGGNVACNSGGPRCLKYGTTKDYVIGLTVVLADGRLLKCGGKVIKDATGYQLAQLFVGSEGTLGIVTEIILKLIPLPRHRSTAAAIFPEIDMASQSITAIMTSGILPATIELLDNTSINVAEDYLNIGLPRAAEGLLLLEQDGGDADAARRDVERMAEICRAQGAIDVKVAATAEERDGLWRARRAVSAALGRVRPNKLGEDIVVPRGSVPEMIRRVRKIQEEVGLPRAAEGLLLLEQDGGDADAARRDVERMAEISTQRAS